MPAVSPLLLVDGHNLLWRAAFGFPAEIRSRDKTRDLTAVFGFFALLRVAIRDELPAPEVIVVFDGEHGSAERQDSDADYKAQRVLDDGARKALEAIPDVQRGLDLYGLSWIEIETAEADDVIATLITHLHTRDPHRLGWIFSTDRDYYQLLDEQVRVLNTAMHRVSGMSVPTRSKLATKYGQHSGRLFARSKGIRPTTFPACAALARPPPPSYSPEDSPSTTWQPPGDSSEPRARPSSSSGSRCWLGAISSACAPTSRWSWHRQAIRAPNSPNRPR